MKSGCKGTIRGWFALAAIVLLGSFVPAVQPSSAQVAPAAFGLPWTPPANAVRIKVDPAATYLQGYRLDDGGLYALTYADLAAAGLPVATLDPRSLQMFYMGQEIPISVLGEQDGVFDAADVVLFYGRTVDSLHLDGVLPTNKYTGTNIYWLAYGCAVGPCTGPYGLRMAEVDGSGAGDAPAPFAHRERLIKSTVYQSAYPFEHDADHWFADAQNPGTRTHDTYSFDAYHLAADVPGSLTLRFLGWSAYAHQLLVWINGTPLITASDGWSGYTFYETTVEVPRALLVEGANQIRVGIAAPAGAPTDQVYLDWWDFAYPDTYVAENNVLAFGNANAGTWRYAVSNFATPDIEVYDVTDPLAPQRVVSTNISETAPHTVSFGAASTGAARYLAVATAGWRKPTIEAVSYGAHGLRPDDLRSAANSAEYVLITHRAFWDQAVTLAEYRAREFRVALVDVQQIYDQFNGGMMSAEAIRDFLAYAHANWGTPGPAYVLLMGDGTNDMRKYQTATNTYIPPYLYLADPDLGETAADNRYVTFIGNDNIPDMHIGRFPVNDGIQAKAMVDKTVQYEVSCQCDADDPWDATDDDLWQEHALFVADDLEGGGGDFHYYSDLIADGYIDDASTDKLLPGDDPETVVVEGFTVQKEYLGLSCFKNTSTPPVAVECRDNIVNTLNTTGSLFVSYVGHATKPAWAAEKMLDVPTINSGVFTNGPCLPIMLAMTCYEGSFHDYNTPDTVAEASVRLSYPDDPATPENEYRTPGAVASFSPTGFGLVTGHDYLEKGMMLAWFHEGIDRLGASATYAKQYLVDNAPVGKYLDLLDTFLLLGDPALQVKTADACLAPTAVMMDHFSARGERGGIRVTWQTADESDLLGFNVLRRALPTGASAGEAVEDFTTVNGEIILAQQMGVAAGASYAYLDRDVRPGRTYQYLLEIVKLDGSHEFYGPAESGMIDLRLPAPHVDPGNQ